MLIVISKPPHGLSSALPFRWTDVLVVRPELSEIAAASWHFALMVVLTHFRRKLELVEEI